jgi:hypothetical protein
MTSQYNILSLTNFTLLNADRIPLHIKNAYPEMMIIITNTTHIPSDLLYYH